MATTNQRIAAIFQQMADVLAILDGDRFRILSFAKAARVVDELVEDLATVGPDEKKLATIEGIGKGTAQRIAEYLSTGAIGDHQKLLSEIPPGLPALLDLPGMGPKTVALLWREAGVDSLERLKEKLQGDALTKIKGFGPKKVQNLRDNLAFIAQAGQRVLLGVAQPVAVWFVQKLKQVKGVKDATYAGSLRRGKETIGDIDLLVAAEAQDAAAISSAFVALEPVTQVIAQGKTKTSVYVQDRLQVDLRIVEPESYGAAMLYFTGSKEHNVLLRERAIKQGMKLNEYALSRDDKPVAGRTEQEVYKALKLAWIPPELRQGRDELALAEEGRLPELVTLKDIVAELHTHTTASDGSWSIEELAQHAIERGCHTLAITDHSRSQPIANGLSAERLVSHIKAIRKAAAAFKGKLTILAGSEVDILADGSLDYPDELLSELDIVVASPHHALSQEPEKATARLLKAIENPYVTILGHPTGRLVGRRQGLSPDMPRLIAAAAARGIAMEINANTYRLDLRDTHARAAIEQGVKLAINTDAHGPADFDQLVYGVQTARRAGAQASDIINCMSKAALAKWIAGTRA